MTTQKSHQLSPAQAYYLQVLGVDLYALYENEHRVEKQVAESNQNITPSLSPSIEDVKRKLQARSKPQPQKPPMLMSEQAFKQSQLVADLCVLQGVDVDEVKTLGDDCFQIGQMKWRFVQQLDKTSDRLFKFADNQLVSEPVSKLTGVDIKRALWSALMSRLR